MKIRLSPVLIAFIFITFLFNSCAFAQVTAPDYSKWESGESGHLQAMHNGKEVSLPVAGYDNYDQSSMLEQSAIVINDESDKPWLMFYVSVQHAVDGTNEWKPQYHFFEYTDGKWVHVKDFTDTPDAELEKDTANLLKSRYNLELF